MSLVVDVEVSDAQIRPVCGVGELSVFCQSCIFIKTLIRQAGSIGGKTRQEVEVIQ